MYYFHFGATVEKTSLLTHRFLEIGWHFPDNPKIDGDTHRVLKSRQILNLHGARAKIYFFNKNAKQCSSGLIQFLLPKSFFS